MPLGGAVQLGCGSPQFAPGLLKYHTGNALQAGSGLGGLFSSLFSKLIPFAAKAGKAALRGVSALSKSKVGQELKSTAISAAKNALADIVEGNDPKIGLQQKVSEAKQQLAEAIRDIGGGGVKRKSADDDDGLDEQEGGGGIPKKVRKYKKRKKFIFTPSKDFDLLGS